MLGDGLHIRRDRASGDECSDGMAVRDGQPEPAPAGDDEVHNRPAQRQAARLAGEAAHHLGAPADLAQGSLEQVGGAPALAQVERTDEMRGLDSRAWRERQHKEDWRLALRG